MNKARFLCVLCVCLISVLIPSNILADDAEIQRPSAVPADSVSDEEDNQENTSSEKLKPGSGEVFMNIGDIVVSERKQAAENVDLPGSVDVMGWETLKYENLDNSLEYLRKIPGVAIGDYGNGGVPNGFTLRGFDSNSHGSHTTVTIDGIPINSHLGSADGAPDLNQLTAEEVDRIELIKGPIDVRYGNWSQAGILHLHTRTRGDFQKAKVSYGSWEYKKLYATLGSEHFEGKFNQVYSAEYFTTEGWRDDADRQRQNAYAKWYYRPSDNIQIGLHTHVYDADWQTSGYLPESYWEVNPRQGIPTSEDDGGYKELTEGSLHLDWDISPDITLATKTWMIQDTYARYADWGSGQTEGYWENTTYGITSAVDWQFHPTATQQIQLDIGLDYRYFDSHGETWNTEARHRTSLVAGDSNNGDFELVNYGIFTKVNYDPVRFLRLFAGVRQDWFTGNVTYWETGNERQMKDYDATTYKGGIIVTPLPDYSFYGNIGTTFALPKGTAKYDAGAHDERDFFFWELGFKAQPISWLLFRYAYFDYAEDGLALVGGEWVSQGDASRRGHEFELNVQPIDSLEFFAAYTLYDTEYTNGDNAGNELACIPDYLLKLGAQYTVPRIDTQFRVWYSNAGPWHTDATNEHSYSGYQVVDFKVVQPLAEVWQVSFDIKNLLDETYSEFVSYWSGENQYAGSNARAVYVTLTYNF